MSEEEPKPKPKFNLNRFKLDYGSKDNTRDVCRWVWEHWNENSHTFWLAELKDELKSLYADKMGFEISNRIGGYFRYLDKIKSRAFATGLALEKEINEDGDTENTIHILWIFEGKKLNKELRKDTVAGKGIFHDFNWKKMDVSKEEVRKLIDDYLCWEDEIDGMTYLAGKVM